MKWELQSHRMGRCRRVEDRRHRRRAVSKTTLERLCLQLETVRFSMSNSRRKMAILEGLRLPIRIRIHLLRPSSCLILSLWRCRLPFLRPQAQHH
jgi:hypothetical protein